MSSEERTGIYYRGPEESFVRRICKEMFGGLLRPAEQLDRDSLERKILVYETKGGETKALKAIAGNAQEVFIVGSEDCVKKYNDDGRVFSIESLESNGIDFRAALHESFLKPNKRGLALVLPGPDRTYMETLYSVLTSSRVQTIEVGNAEEVKNYLANLASIDFIFLDIDQKDLVELCRTKQPRSYLALMSKGMRKNWPNLADNLLVYQNADLFRKQIAQAVDYHLAKKAPDSGIKGDSSAPAPQESKIGTVFTVHGPTAAGKSTLISELASLGYIEDMVRYTDRPKRECEVEGVDYTFVTPKRFTELSAKGAFLFEHAGLHSDNRYAFPESLIRHLAEGKACACQLKRIDSVSLLRKRLREILSPEPKMKSILIYAPPDVCSNRIRRRHPDDLRTATIDPEAAYFDQLRHSCDYLIDTSKWSIESSARMFENIVIHENKYSGESFADVITRRIFRRNLFDLEPISCGLDIPGKLILQYAREVSGKDVDYDSEIFNRVASATARGIKCVHFDNNHAAILLSDGWASDSEDMHPKKVVLDLIERAIPYKPVFREEGLTFREESAHAGFQGLNFLINDGLVYAISDFRNRPDGKIYQIYLGFYKKENDSPSEPRIKPIS